MPSPGRPKILLLIPHLGGGGAEHVIASLASSLDPTQYEIHLGLVVQSDPAPYNIPPQVVVHALGAKRVRRSTFRVLQLVWRVRPILILSSMAHLNLLVLMLRPFFPQWTHLCVRQNGTLPATFAAHSLPSLARLFYAAAYRSADRVICQSDSMSSQLRNTLKIDPVKLSVLPNPVDIQAIRAVSRTANIRSSPAPRLLAVARLAPEKGIDLLLEAFAHTHSKFPNVELEILGAGLCRAALEEQRNALQLEKYVHFHGNVPSPADYFSGTSVFVLSSRHEGLPNALLEAAAAGLPIVALPASQGIVSLLGSRSGVWLASEISAAALEAALSEALNSIHPGQRFPHTWIDDFDRAKAISAHEELIDAVLLERNS